MKSFAVNSALVTDEFLLVLKNPPELLSCRADTLTAIKQICVVLCVFPRVMVGGEGRTKEAESFVFFPCLGNEILPLNFTLPFLLLIFFFFCDGYLLRGS